MKNILVPCDFSSPAQEAFKFALKLAMQSNGHIHVLNILDITFLHGNPTLSHSYAFNVNFLKDMAKEAEDKFRVMWEKYAPLTLPVKFVHKVGSLTMGIEEYTDHTPIDLVIMGTRGEAGPGWGSNTTKIVRNSEVPVFVVRKAPRVDIKKIVVPVIPDQLGKSGCEKIKQLQAFFKASLLLLWINTPRLFKNDKDSQTSLQQFAEQAGFTDFTVNIRSDYTAEEGIYHFTREIDADMIAMSTHGWKGLIHAFTGSVTENIVNEIEIPIFTFH